jgi:hypothetical protein
VLTILLKRAVRGIPRKGESVGGVPHSLENATGREGLNRCPRVSGNTKRPFVDLVGMAVMIACANASWLTLTNDT